MGRRSYEPPSVTFNNESIYNNATGIPRIQLRVVLSVTDSKPPEGVHFGFPGNLFGLSTVVKLDKTDVREQRLEQV
jgi:hypothetical protein